jgi:polysaccharide biosynthesis/export protein VpsN
MSLKNNCFIHYTILLFLLSFLYSFSIAEEVSRYELKSGDKIKIIVYGEEDLTLETIINNDNIIRYPFLGNINIKSMTIGELERFITKRLDGDYIISPNVYISVLEYRSFYIRGEVRTPGAYPYKPGLTIQKAISIAGGFTDHAAKNKIYLVHENDLKNRFKVNQSEKIGPGDVITVEESFF